MSRWTRANPLAAVPGYGVPAGHFANGYTNGGDRVNFKVGGRVALKRGSRDKPMSKTAGRRDPRTGHIMPGPHKKAGAGKVLFSTREREKWTPGRGRPSKYEGEKDYFGAGSRLKGQTPKDFQKTNRHKIYTKHWSKKAEGGRIELKKGGWIQDATASIKKRGTKGKCTPITKKGCTGRAKALARTFKKMAKKRKGK